MWDLWLQTQSPSWCVAHCGSGKSFPATPGWEPLLRGLGKRDISRTPGRSVWVVKVGAGLSGGGDSCPSLQPSETSPVAWFIVSREGRALPAAGVCGQCVEEVGVGRGGQGSLLSLPPPGLSWAEPWTVLVLSLYRKWELPALPGAGPLPR